MKTKNSQKTKNPYAHGKWLVSKRQGRPKQYWTVDGWRKV